MNLIFSQLSLIFTFSDSLQVLKSLLMSGRVESGVLDEGDSAGVPQDSFFRDMFLNVTHIQVHLNKLECCEKVNFFL